MDLKIFLLDLARDLLFLKPRPTYKILVADDSTMQLKVAEDAIHALGHKMVPAKTGKQAYALAFEEQPDLIILDMNMETVDGMNGIEVLENLRFDQKTKHIPVLVCTAETSKNTEERAALLGAMAYLSKPMSAPRLKETILKLERNKLIAAKGR